MTVIEVDPRCVMVAYFNFCSLHGHTLQTEEFLPSALNAKDPNEEFPF